AARPAANAWRANCKLAARPAANAWRASSKFVARRAGVEYARIMLASASLLLLRLLASGASVPPSGPQIDQLGYVPSEFKWVAIPRPASQARIRTFPGGALVLTAPASLRRAADPASGDSVYSADFSALTTPGLYY